MLHELLEIDIYFKSVQKLVVTVLSLPNIFGLYF